LDVKVLGGSEEDSDEGWAEEHGLDVEGPPPPKILKQQCTHTVPSHHSKWRRYYQIGQPSRLLKFIPEDVGPHRLIDAQEDLEQSRERPRHSEDPEVCSDRENHERANVEEEAHGQDVLGAAEGEDAGCETGANSLPKIHNTSQRPILTIIHSQFHLYLRGASWQYAHVNVEEEICEEEEVDHEVYDAWAVVIGEMLEARPNLRFLRLVHLLRYCAVAFGGLLFFVLVVIFVEGHFPRVPLRLRMEIIVHCHTVGIAGLPVALNGLDVAVAEARPQLAIIIRLPHDALTVIEFFPPFLGSVG